MSPKLPREVENEFGSLFETVNDQKVLFPKDAQDVVSIVRTAKRFGVEIQHLRSHAVSEQGGQIAYIDFAEMNRVLELDEVSNFVHVQAGVTFKQLEMELAQKKLTLQVPLDSSLMNVQIGPAILQGTLPIDRNEHDPVDQMVAGLEAVFPHGEWVRIRPAPRRAVGPDVASMFWGSHGVMGLVVSAYLLVKPKIEIGRVVYQFADFASANKALAWMRGYGVRPIRVALGETQSAVQLDLWLPDEGLLSEPFRRVADEVARDCGGSELSPEKLTSLIESSIESKERDFSHEKLGESFYFHPTRSFSI